MKILLIEDNPGDARLIRELIKEADPDGYELVHVQSMQEARNQLEGKPFDIVLSDLGLPDSSGLETLQRLLVTTRGTLPIVVLTGLDDSDTALQAIEQGAQDYLVKGEFGPNLLLRSIIYAQQRKQMEKTLRKHQEGLEELIEERTRQLRESQEATLQQERLRALGQMASGIVHDINNALSPIMGYTELLLNRTDKLDERQQRYLKSIAVSATDIAHIVTRMREFYRKREEQELVLPVDLNQIVEQVVAMTRPRWKDIPQEQGVVVALTTDLADDLPLQPGNENEVREALVNLVINAVDAMPSGGNLTIRTRKTQDGVVVEVVDQGEGMDEKTKRHCLDPFFTTKGDKGTGLGLGLVYGVMQRHDGAIDIDSTPGRGTRVRLVFPSHDRPVEKTEEEGETSLPEPMHILYVDDEANLRSLLKEMLSNDGHIVEVADGGEAGVEAFVRALEESRPFDVVITDLGMPYVDGREVVQKIRERSPGTPVVLLTGWGGRLKAEGSLPEDVVEVLSKPPSLTELRKALLKSQILAS